MAPGKAGRSSDENGQVEKLESKVDKVEKRAEQKLLTEVAKNGFSSVNEKVQQRVLEQRLSGKSGATRNGVPSAKSLLGDHAHESLTKKSESKLSTGDLKGYEKGRQGGDAHLSAEKPGPSLLDWANHGGDTLARQVAESTPNGGLMLLGPMDTMRAEAKNYKDPDNYFPVFTHASSEDFHMYYGLHQGRKEYSVQTLAELIKKNVPEGQPIRLLGCESGLDSDGGVAHQLAKLLPQNPVYAPDGYCQLKNGESTVYKKKPSEMPHLDQEPPKGEFVLIKP